MSLSEQVYLLSGSLGPTHQSSLHEGLLISQDMCASLLSLPRGRGLEEGGCVITAVVDASLAGDLEEGMEFDVVGVAGGCVEEVLEAELVAMGEVLVERGVGLLACQKCVHPTLKDYLHGKVR